MLLFVGASKPGLTRRGEGPAVGVSSMSVTGKAGHGWSALMTKGPDRHARAMLPIPDWLAPGLTTYDAKDPDTAFPPIEPLLPPEGRRTC